MLNEEERKRLCENIAGHLKDAQLFIQKKAVSLALIAKGCPLLASGGSAAAWENPCKEKQLLQLSKSDDLVSVFCLV